MYWGSLFLNLELNESLVFVFDTVEQQHSEKKDKFSFGWLKAVTQTGLKHYSQFILSLVCAKFAQTSCTFRWFLPGYTLILCWFGNLLQTKFTICVGLVINSPCLMSTCIRFLNIPLSDQHYHPLEWKAVLVVEYTESKPLYLRRNNLSAKVGLKLYFHSVAL